MLKTRLSVITLLLFALSLLSACGGGSDQQTGADAGAQVDGEIVGGLRVLTIHPTAQDQHFTIFRGDYVRAQLTTGEPFNIKIAALDVDKDFPVAEDEKPYFKVPDAGSFRFSVGEGNGVIEALELRAKAYREVKSAEAVKLIENLNPVIVDVRTPREYQGGHLENSRLIPVQEFQRRVGELGEHKNDPVFLYCRTGNRSTVAAKVLLDNGFTNVINLRHGIVEWQRSGLPTVK